MGGATIDRGESLAVLSFMSSSSSYIRSRLGTQILMHFTLLFRRRSEKNRAVDE